MIDRFEYKEEPYFSFSSNVDYSYPQTINFDAPFTFTVNLSSC